MGSDEAVVLDADRDRLRVAEPVGRRMAAAAGVVGMQGVQRIEPQQPAQIGELRMVGLPRLVSIRDA
jgi:hypothetical protein